MSESEIEPRLIQVFLEVAPDIDPAQIKREVDFRDQFDFDSMDTLNFAIGLHEAFDIEIPDTDFRQLASLSKAAAYVARQLARNKKSDRPAPGT